LRSEYEEKLSAVAEAFALKGEVVSAWGAKKAAIEAKMTATATTATTSETTESRSWWRK
jgi:hypothetical protein